MHRTDRIFRGMVDTVYVSGPVYGVNIQVSVLNTASLRYMH